MITIKGNISSTTGNINDVSITISGKNVQAGTYNANFQTLKTGTADASGNFSMEIKKENISEYKISITKYKYFNTDELFYSRNFTDGIFSKNYTINPSADITIIVKNTSPVDEKDYFRYKITTGYANASEGCSETSEFFGTSVDEEYSCKVIGNQYVVFEWMQAKNGTTTGTKSVFCDINSDNIIEFYY